MPTVSGRLNSYQEVEVEVSIDLSDHLDHVDVEVDTDDLVSAISEDYNTSEIIGLFDLSPTDVLDSVPNVELVAWLNANPSSLGAVRTLLASTEVVNDLAQTEPLAPPPAPTPDPATLYALGAMVDALRFTIAEAIGRGGTPNTP